MDASRMLRRYRKKKGYKARWEINPHGAQVRNDLDGRMFETDELHPVIMTGSQGEQWVISAAKLMRDYEVNHDELFDGACGVAYQRADGRCIHARKADGIEEVMTADGQLIASNLLGVDHGDGDWIAFASDKNGNPTTDDIRIINGLVFADMYELDE